MLLRREAPVQIDDEGDRQQAYQQEKRPANELAFVLEQAPGAARVIGQRKAEVLVDDLDGLYGRAAWVQPNLGPGLTTDVQDERDGGDHAKKAKRGPVGLVRPG